MKVAKRRNAAAAAGFALTLAACAALAAGISHMGRSAETGLVRDAVKNAALTCYAVEGAYPPDLQYLREHYGLRYNQNRYAVFYDAFASNLMPEIQVVARSGR